MGTLTHPRRSASAPASVLATMLLSASALAASLGPGDDIAAAIAAAADGEAIALSAGVYELSAELVVDRPMTITGAGAGLTILKRSGSVANMRLLRVSADATVEHLTLLGGNLTSKYGGYETGSAAIFSDGTIRDCEIACCTNRMTGKKGATLALGGTASARRCLIRDNFSLDNHGGAVYLAGSAVMSHSVICGNVNRSVRVFSGGSGSIVTLDSSTAAVSNCTVTANFAARYGAVYTKTGQVYDSIIWGNAGSDTGLSGFNTDGTAAKFVRCHVSGNPDFVDPASGDYRLALSSPLDGSKGACEKVDAGTLPACSFLAAETKVLAGSEVSFSAVCANLPAVGSYAWDFGDGGTETTTEPGATHSYSQPGVYGVTLTVSGAAPCTRAAYISVMPADLYVDAASAAPAPPYATPATAARDVAEAVALAISGATVHVASGNYGLTDILTVPAGVALIGSGFEDCILRQTVGTRAVSILTGSRLEGVTVTGGNLPAAWNGCAGVKCTGGRIAYCSISNNVVGGNNVQGGGISLAGGVVTHSIVCFNRASYRSAGGSGYGGGIYVSASSVMDNCLVYENEARNSGGGIYLNATCYMTNCTVVGNTAYSTEGGGFYVPNSGSNSRIVNCIFSDNIAENDSGDGAPNYAGTAAGLTALESKVSHCLYGNGSASFGASCVSGGANFRSLANHDFRLAANSLAKDAGFATALPPPDLDGNPRDASPDIGCYEYVAALEPFGCVLDFSPLCAFADEPVSFEGEAINPPSGPDPEFIWTLVDQDGSTSTFTGAASSRAIGRPGLYTVTLSATVGASSVQATSEFSLLVAARTNYVASAGNAGAAFPFDTPATAAEHIADVLPWIIDGSTVVLDAGRHLLDAEIALSVGARLVGMGRGETIVARRTANAGRCFHLNHPSAELRAMCIEGGFNAAQFSSGGNVLIDPLGGILRDCTIRAGRATGSFNGTGGAGIASLSRSTLVENCIFEANTNDHPTADNYTLGSAAYILSGTFRNCLFVGNVGHVSATVYAAAGATVDNCTFVANDNYGANERAVALWLNGAATVRNCLFAGNVSAANTAGDSATVGKPNWFLGGTSYGSKVSNCCWSGSTDLGTSPARSTGLAFKEGGWRPLAVSPAWNAGAVLDWMVGARDLDGHPRIAHGRPDIGCYESPGRRGLMIDVR